MKLIFLLLSLFSGIVNCFDSTSIVCSQIPKALDLSQNLSYLWGKATMQTADRYAFLIISPILIIGELVLLKFYYNNSKAIGRADIIITVVIVFEIFLNLHFLCSATYYAISFDSQEMPSSFPLFCQINSIMAAFFQIIHIIFLLLVPIYIVYVLRSSLKDNSKIWRFVYLATFIISAVVTYILWYQNFLGLNIFGLCGLTFIRYPNSSLGIPITIFSITVVFILIGIFSFRYFKKHMPNSIGLRKKKRYEEQVILLYVVGYIIFGILDSVILLVLYLNCNKETPQTSLFPLISIYNFVRLLECLYIFFIIFKNQNLRRTFKKFLKKIFSKRKRDLNLKKADSITNQTASNPNNNDFHNFQEVLLSIHQQNNNFDLLKISQVVTIVSGIYIAYKQYYNIQEEYFHTFAFQIEPSQAQLDRATLVRRNANANFSKSTKNIYYHQKMTIKINLQIVQDFIQDLTLLPKFGILECSMIIHSPKIFQHLLENDKLQSIFLSFQLHQNARKMFDLAQGQGGKSGQFFFYSSDNKFVLKTITPQQFQFLDRNLFYFHEHFIRNPDSILAKIYGLFTFKGDQMQRTYHLILMKNMLACNNNQILRTYDMKGSRYDREVNIKNKQINELQKMTLKDIDFMKEEGIIHVSNENKLKLSEIITKDSLFLKNLNLIDYSLLVIKVKWLVTPRNPQFWSKYQRLQSSIKKDEYYHIGIIDYLQQWDLQKKGEQWWKNLLGKKDISAQEPKYYQNRFVTFVGQITSDFCLRKQIQIPNCDDQMVGKGYFSPTKIEQDLLKLEKLECDAEYLKQKINYITVDKEIVTEKRQIEMSLSNNIGSSLSRQREKMDEISFKSRTVHQEESCRSHAGSSSTKRCLTQQPKQKYIHSQTRSNKQ